MKTKLLLTVMGVLIIAGGIWLGLEKARSRNQLVTLNVRNLPLVNVLKKIERQTGTKIRAEKSLDALITLQVNDRPLSNVLDRLSEQAGAQWSTLYAVYDSAGALASLDNALGGDGKLEPAGWKKLAPTLPTPDQMPENGRGPFVNAGPGPGAPDRNPDQHGMLLMRRGPNGPVVFQGGSDGQELQIWSPTELVVESSLVEKAGSNADLAATPETAADLAKTVAGKWTTYIALRKSIMGMSLSGMPPGQPEMGGPMPNPSERFTDLTPEQRVKRAREQQHLTSE